MATSPSTPPSPITPHGSMSSMMRTPNHGTSRSNSRLGLGNANKITPGTKTSDDEQKTTVKVVVRVRPPLESVDEKLPQRHQRSVVQVLSPTTMSIDSPQAQKEFVFDQVFDQHVNQDGIWDYLMESIDHFTMGYNVSMLAYGQSGSGKSYTMGTTGSSNQSDPQVMGVIPRAATALFNTLDGPKFSTPLSNRHSITALRTPTKYTTQSPSTTKSEKSWTLKATYVEIYNETLKDLLVPDSVPIVERDQVIIREDKDGHIIMAGLRQREINSVEDLMLALNYGSEIRQTGSTYLNDASSRSHAVFSLNLVQRKQNTSIADKRASLSSPVMERSNGHESWTTTDSKLHFVDLAGSERLKATGAQGDRAREGININAGLATLGKVISQLSSAKRNVFVSYRDSKLTRMLRDSLGGDAFTYMIACVAPAEAYVNETISTVSYASRARAIPSKPKIQQITDDTDKLVLIDSLRTELALVRRQLQSFERERDSSARTQNGWSEQQQSMAAELTTMLLSHQHKFSNLSERHTQLLSQATQAGEQDLKDVEALEDQIGSKASERLERSTSFAEAVEQVILEYEKTIQTLEASLANTRSMLHDTQANLQDCEGRSAHAETVNLQLQARLQKMIDRESTTEHYLHDLEAKLDGHTSGEEKSVAIITELRKEISRLRENEAGCEDYISTLEERLADAEEDSNAMQQEMNRLEQIIERQRSLGKLDHLLSELDQIQQTPNTAPKSSIAAMKLNGDGHTKDPWAHSRRQSLASRRGRIIDLPNGKHDYAVVDLDGRSPVTSEVDGPVEDGQDIEVESDTIDHAIDDPPHDPAQSKFMQDKLDNVTQELLDLRGEHETTVHDYDLLSAKYEEALRTLAELREATDDSHVREARHSMASNSTGPNSFLADARVNELKLYGGQYSPSQSLSSELSSVGESMGTNETSDVGPTHRIGDTQDDTLAHEIGRLRKLAYDQDASYKDLMIRHEQLEQEHKRSLEATGRLRAEVKQRLQSDTTRPRSRNSALLEASPRTISPIIRRKSSHSILMVDKAHRSFASLRNIATENFEDKPDVMQAFELNLNSAMHELHSRSERVQELESDVASLRKEMEAKTAIISGLTRERSSIRSSSTMDASIVSSMKEQILYGEKQIKELQCNSTLRENELLTEIDSLQATIASYAHQAATAKVKEQRLTMTSMTSQDTHMTDFQAKLSAQAEEHQRIIADMQKSERQLLSTIAELATRVVAPPSNSSAVFNNFTDEHDNVAKDEMTLKQQEVIFNFQRELEAHRLAIAGDDSRVSELENAHKNTKHQLDETLTAQELLTAALDEHKAQIQLQTDIVDRLEAQVLTQQSTIQSYEENIAKLHEDHAKRIGTTESNLSSQHTLAMENLKAQHEQDMIARREELAEAKAILDAIARAIHTATAFPVDFDSLSSTIAELAADQRALVSMQGKHDQLETQMRELTGTHHATLAMLEKAQSEHASLVQEVAANASLKAEHATTTVQLSDLKQELQKLEAKNEKNSRLVEELEEQLSSNFDQHQMANNRLSNLQSERNALLEEANASQSAILSELEMVKEAYANLQGEFHRLTLHDDPGDRRVPVINRSPVLHKNASVSSLYSQPPNMPLPALPGNKSIHHVTKNSMNSIMKAPLSPTFSVGTRSPSPPQRVDSLDIKYTEMRIKCEDQEARIRTIEKHLVAEKQLTATLEEALTDLERQSNKVKSDCDAWRQRASDLENDLKTMKEREKERSGSTDKERFSMNVVEEEKRKRKDAEAARAHLEERMNALGKKKKKKGLNCF